MRLSSSAAAGVLFLLKLWGNRTPTAYQVLYGIMQSAVVTGTCIAASATTTTSPTTTTMYDTHVLVHTQGIAAYLSEHGRTAAIVSGDPAGLTPFER